MTLSASHVTLRRGARVLLDDASAAFEPGRLSFLIGPNGAGKSTLLRLLAGIEAPDAGVVRLGSDDLARLAPLERARRVAWVPAETHAAFAFPARAVVLMGRYPWHLGRPRPADEEKARAALERVGVAAHAERPLSGLSSGERQKVQLARALASDAAYLLLDEPLANLDLAAGFAVMDVLRDEAARGRGIVVVAHDLSTAHREASHLVCLAGGRVVAAGPPARALTAPLLAEVFAVRASLAKDLKGFEHLVFEALR